MRQVVVAIVLLALSLSAAAQTGVPDGGRLRIGPDDAVVPSRFGSRPSDPAYGAFQRGLYITALDLATPRALAGDAAAQTLIAEIHSRGLGVPRDPVKAFEWYAKAAEQGVTEAQFQLAMLLLDGGPELRDEARSRDLMKQAADAGHRLARFNYAQLLLSDGGEKAMAEAAGYFEQAAQAGLADAQFAIAEVLRTGSGGRERDLAEARRWLTLAARQNFDTAQIELGTWLVEGVGGPRDLEGGFGWLSRAAEAGNPAAQTRLAKLYIAGLGVEQDPVAAAGWYMRARQAGLVDTEMEDHLLGLTDEQIAEASERSTTLR